MDKSTVPALKSKNQESVLDLVSVNRKNVFCDSRNVAKKFEVDHRNVTRAIEFILGKMSRSKSVLKTNYPSFEKLQHEYRGRSFKYYAMNKPGFIMLSMRFETDVAFEWQIKFVAAFEMMESRIAMEESNKKDSIWAEQRNQGKLIRLTAMDTVKEFVDYATQQGSQNAKFYYQHITTACYKCLELIQAKRPKLRDTLDMLQLHQLMMAEIVAERSIRKHMAEGEHYKTIFTLVKGDLEKFADSLMIQMAK